MSKLYVVLATLAIDTIALALILYPSLSRRLQDIWKPSATSATVSYALDPAATRVLPVRLTIPKIRVDAVIEHLGLTAAGAMDAPRGRSDVGWFALGTLPGEEGSAVIDGHFGWKNGLPAVFDGLHTLRPGDKIYVVNAGGVATTFVVRSVGMYVEDGYPASVFSSTDGGAHLNLITCEGVWNKERKSYSNRLIVFADKESTYLAPLSTPRGGQILP